MQSSKCFKDWERKKRRKSQTQTEKGELQIKLRSPLFYLGARQQSLGILCLFSTSLPRFTENGEVARDLRAFLGAPRL